MTNAVLSIAETDELVRRLLRSAADGPVDHWQRNRITHQVDPDRWEMELVAKDDFEPFWRITAAWRGRPETPRDLVYTVDDWPARTLQR